MTEERYKIMIVDDEPSVCRITELSLQDSIDADIETFTDPNEASLALGSGDYAVLVTDYKMPGMSGFSLAKKASDINDDTVVIMVTALATKEMLIEILNDGSIWKCMEKPWNADKLIALVNEALEMYESRFSETQSRIEMEEMLQETTSVETSSVPRVETPGPKFRIKRSDISSTGKRRRKMRKSASSLARKLGGRQIKIKGKTTQQSRPGRKKVARKKIAKRIVPKRDEPVREDKVDKSRYTDLHKIAEGGSGVIFKAHDSLLNMPVAIKVLAPHIANDPTAIDELFSEARLAMQLSHKHIVRLHNIEETAGTYYLVMEYIDGYSFREVLNEDGMFSEEMCVQILDICDDALSYAHRRDIYHRDIKPENIMLTSDGVLKIIDFGLACLAERKAGEDDMICGSPFYISPEELNGYAVDSRGDLFSLAIMTHELITGSLPIDPAFSKDEVDFLTFIPVVDESLSPDLQMVFKKAWEVNPDDRYADVHEFVSAFKSAIGA